jgi:hypothetical protein
MLFKPLRMQSIGISHSLIGLESCCRAQESSDPRNTTQRGEDELLNKSPALGSGGLCDFSAQEGFSFLIYVEAYQLVAEQGLRQSSHFPVPISAPLPI